MKPRRISEYEISEGITVLKKAYVFAFAREKYDLALDITYRLDHFLYENGIDVLALPHVKGEDIKDEK